MPTYQYRCKTCEEQFEIVQSFSDDALTVCPDAADSASPPGCTAPGRGEVRKVFSAPGITFKGDGFYKTDSRSSSKKKGAKSSSGSSSESSDSSSGDSKSSSESGSSSEKSSSEKSSSEKSSSSSKADTKS